MATTAEETSTTGEARCTYHPSVLTRLRCSRCGKPICPRCGVRTPVGMRCPECAGVRGLPTYATSTSSLARATAVGAAIAIAVGVLWGYAPTWGFYLALLLGFGVAEGITWAVNAKRGRDLQLLAMAMAALGLAISRAVMAQRFGVSWEQINELTPKVEDELSLRVVPDLLFAAISLVICWVRFR